jgi:hypothetical protein
VCGGGDVVAYAADGGGDGGGVGGVEDWCVRGGGGRGGRDVVGCEVDGDGACYEDLCW